MSDKVRLEPPAPDAAGARAPKELRRGRGAVSNASGRYEPTRREAFDDGWDIPEERSTLKTELMIDAARSVIARNTSPDIPFDRSINPYRGCEHGCVYCFARPSHAFLGLSPGLDFESRIFVKPDAAARLAEELGRSSYRPAPIAIGTNTDPYQPVERGRLVMREILETLARLRHPVTIVTKGALIARDAALLGEMAADGLAHASISLTTLDPKVARAMEPRASTPARRLWAIERLAAAGVPVGVMTAPIVPGLTDHEIEALLEAAAAAGARFSNYVLLRLPLEVADLFKEWLAESYPDRAARVMKLVRETQGGRDYTPEWGRRLRGDGVFANLVARRFSVASRRLGLADAPSPLRTDLFRRPADARQLSLNI